MTSLRERFHLSVGPITVADLASRLGATLPPQAEGARCLTGVAPLDLAGPSDLSFLENPKYKNQARATKAGAVVLRPDQASLLPAGVVPVLTPMPYATYAKAAALMYLAAAAAPGVSPAAHVHPTATLGAGVSVGPGAVVDAGAELADGVTVGAGAYVGPKVKIGADTVLGPRVVVQYAVVGARCLLHPGVAIGQDGFGFAYDGKQVVKVPQLGGVQIGDDVEIGANSTIDRGTLADTVIGSGTKIDNLVQIGHNVVIGRMCQIVSQVGIAGSATLGDGVIVGGQAAIAGHLQVAPGVMIAARSGVSKSIPTPKAVVAGLPAIPIQQWRRQQVVLARLGRRNREEDTDVEP